MGLRKWLLGSRERWMVLWESRGSVVCCIFVRSRVVYDAHAGPQMMGIVSIKVLPFVVVSECRDNCAC